MNDIMRPAAEWELQGIITNCTDRRLPIEVMGAGTKRGIGRPLQPGVVVSTTSLRGIPLYEPGELVMSARAGTSLTQIESELAARNQMLAFEPIDLGPVTGGGAGAQTIGGVFAANLSGSRRIMAGAARDHLLGIRGVNGRAEIFKSGGRVMKNVTGYDLARGLSGSWGTLAVLTEVTFKVLPMPETSVTLVWQGLPEDIAVELLTAAAGTPFEVSAASHLSEALAGRLQLSSLRVLGKSLTLLRIENFASAVAHRTEALRTALKIYGPALVVENHDSVQLWSELRRLSVFPYGPSCLWRLSATPTKAPELVASIRRHMSAEVFYDWAGGLVWLEIAAPADAGATDIRRADAIHGGHATRIRAEPAVRAAIDVFQPQSPAVERITRGLKHAFDPHGLLNPGRMYANL